MIVRDIQAWVVYCDVFGFSAKVKSGDTARISEALHKAHVCLKDYIASRPGKVEARFISDSVFLIYEVDESRDRAQALQRCVEDIQWLMAQFVDQGLPLRGSIAYGGVCLGGDVLLGNPVVQAVRTEALIGLPLVVLPLAETKKMLPSDIPSHSRLVPTKGGGMMKAVVLVPRPIDGLLQLSEALSEEHCVSGPYDVGRMWFEASQFLQTLEKDEK